MSAKTSADSLMGAALVKFMIVGGIGALILLALMWVLVDVLGLHYLLSLPVAYGAAISHNFLLNSRWTFGKHAGMAGYFKFLASSAVALGISEAVLAAATGLLNLHYLAGTAAGMTAGFVFNYLVSRKYVWV